MHKEPCDSLPTVGRLSEPRARRVVALAVSKPHFVRVLRSQRLWLILIGLVIGVLFVRCDWSVLNGVADVALSEAHVATLLRSDKMRFYEAVREPASFALPTAVQHRRFAEALRILQAYSEQADPRLLDQARGLLRSVKYQLVLGTDGYWYIRDRLAARAWGSYVVNRAPRDRLLVEVPRPLDERHVMEAGTAVFYETGAQALAVAGPLNARNPGADVLTSSGTFFQAFHRIYARGSVLAVRSATIAPTNSRGWTPGGASRLWVNGEWSEVEQLKGLVGALVVIWKASPIENLQRRTTPGSYAELYLNGDDAGELVARLESRAVMRANWQPEALKTRLDDWLRAGESARSDSDNHVAQHASQSEFFDREILSPLLRAAQTGYRHGKWTSGTRAQLRAIHYVAQGMGYAVTRLRDSRVRDEYLVLHGTHSSRGRERFVLRAGGGDDYAVNIPDAARAPKALEYGVTLFHSLKARALLVNEEEPQMPPANDGPGMSTGGDDMLAFANRVLKREQGEQAFMVVISRGYAHDTAAPMAQADVSLVLADGTMSRNEATPLARQLLSTVRRSGLSYRFVEAAKDAAGSQTRALNDEVATLWLSPQARVAHGPSLLADSRTKKGRVQNVPAQLSGTIDHASAERDGDNTRTAFLDLNNAQ